MNDNYLKRKVLIIVVIVIVIIFLAYYLISYYKDLRKDTSEIIKNNDSPISLKKDNKKDTNNIKVDIKGEVKKPNIYEASSDDRVIDQTTPNMIQRISGIFERNALISKGI